MKTNVKYTMDDIAKIEEGKHYPLQGYWLKEQWFKLPCFITMKDGITCNCWNPENGINWLNELDKQGKL